MCKTSWYNAHTNASPFAGKLHRTLLDTTLDHVQNIFRQISKFLSSVVIAEAVCDDNACRPYVLRRRCMPYDGSTPRYTTPMTSCWWTLPPSGCRAQTSSRPSRPSLPPPTALLWPMPGGAHTHKVCLSVCHVEYRHCLSVCPHRIQALSVCLSVV